MFLQVAILPENGEDVIRRAADVLGYPLDTVMQFSIPEGSQSSLAAPFTSGHPHPPPACNFLDVQMPCIDMKGHPVAALLPSLLRTHENHSWKIWNLRLHILQHQPCSSASWATEEVCVAAQASPSR